MGIRADHPNHEVGGILGGRLGCGIPLRQFGHEKGVMELSPIPCALVVDFAEELFPPRRFFLAVDQRKHGAWDHRDIGAPDDFEQPQGVCDLFIPPPVAAHHGDPHRIDLGGLDQY